MANNQTRTFPRWIFSVLALGGAWASGIYLGKMTILGSATELLIPALAFAAMALIMGWGGIAGD